MLLRKFVSQSQLLLRLPADPNRPSITLCGYKEPSMTPQPLSRAHDKWLCWRDYVELHQVSSTEGISLSRMHRFHLYRGASALLLELNYCVGKASDGRRRGSLNQSRFVQDIPRRDVQI